VSSSSFRDLLEAAAVRATLTLDPAETDQLEAYFDLFQHWNRTINLTALPLAPPTAGAIDRLFIEPVVAARVLRSRRLPSPNPGIPDSEPRTPIWIDLGSGGGSPAIPMKIALPELDLTMVESRSRKAAFLSEAIRGLGLVRARVKNIRFEELPAGGSADFITSRAIRTDATLELVAQRLLRPGGWLLIFGPSSAVSSGSLVHLETVQLTDSSLHISANVPRGTNPLTSI